MLRKVASAACRPECCHDSAGWGSHREGWTVASLSCSYRTNLLNLAGMLTCRQMFANHKLASAAAEKELQEAQARATVQQQLATAQAQAAHRALTVAREKAANEAKSEFMSLMCHEVRTPLNGCLASAEMLLETPLQVSPRVGCDLESGTFGN